jgi:signal transduction histidine kinase/CheY-like chemotaxis protein
MTMIDRTVRRAFARVAWRFHRVVRKGIPAHLPLPLMRTRYAAQLACPLHLASTAPYAILFALFGAWTLALLVAPLCLAYLVAWILLRKGWHATGSFVILTSVAVSITIFSILLGRASHLDVALFYCTIAPFLFFPAGSIGKIVLANLIPAGCWVFLELVGYRVWSPMGLSGFQVDLFRFFIMPTSALLLLVPLFFLLRSLDRSEGKLRLALSEAQRSNQAKSEFLAMVSHELRTPLNGLLGILEMMESQALKPALQDDLRIARTSGNLLHKLIGDILDYSRLEKGMTILEKGPVQLDALVDSHLKVFEKALREKGLSLRKECDAGFPALQIDPTRFGQVLSNLLGNAVKFTDQGSIRVSMAWRPLGDGRARAILEVEDTGVGLPKERRDAIFRPFEQLHRSRLVNAQGCGLGLAISHQLVTLMGGRIELEDNSPTGLRVRVTLPAEIATAPANIPSAPAIGLPETDGSAKPFMGKILVVDDVRVNQIVATRMLAALGFECDVADDGRQALDYWLRESPSLIFMDLQMPHMDGAEATRAIHKAARYEERELPVILALTANTFDEHRELCRGAGMDGFLEKPLTRSALKDQLDPLMRKRLPHMIRSVG